MRGTILAGGLAAFGMAVNGAAGVIAAAAGNPATLGELISAGGSVSAAGALIYIVKKMTDGQLVARDPARVEQQVVDLAEAAQRALAEAHRRETQYVELLHHFALRRENPT